MWNNSLKVINRKDDKMEIICPLCNGLKKSNQICSNCNIPMKDTGPIENYFDEYSPYLDKSITQFLNSENQEICVHLLSAKAVEGMKRCPYPKFH